MSRYELVDVCFLVWKKVNIRDRFIHSDFIAHRCFRSSHYFSLRTSIVSRSSRDCEKQKFSERNAYFDIENILSREICPEIANPTRGPNEPRSTESTAGSREVHPRFIFASLFLPIQLHRPFVRGCSWSRERTLPHGCGRRMCIRIFAGGK